MFGKFFRSIVLMLHQIGMATNCEKLQCYKLPQFFSVIGVPNLKEIKTREGYFNEICAKEKCEENWQFSRTNILREIRTTAISFKFDMYVK